MAENIIDTLSDEKQKDNPQIQKKRSEMQKNTRDYEVRAGDTIASIALAHGITNYLDLVALNNLLGKGLSWKGKHSDRILIKAGEKIYIPEDSDKFSEDIKSIRMISEAIMKNEKIAQWDASALKKEINERIFPKATQSVGTSRSLGGFVKTQESTLDPTLPRIVDSARQREVSCANLIRTLLAQGLNVDDMTKEEWRFFQKQNLHAWILPEELKMIGFTQPMNLNAFFDSSKIMTQDPLITEKTWEYNSNIIQLGKYLETSHIPGSLVPFWFRRSGSKDKVAAYNHDKEQKHYNTHQSVLAGNASIKFQAHEVGEIRGGMVVPFGGDKKRMEKDLVRLETELVKTKEAHSKKIENLRNALDMKNNPDISKRIEWIDTIIRTYVSYTPKDKQGTLLRAIESKSSSAIRSAKPDARDDDVNYLIALQSKKQRMQNGLKLLQEQLDGKPKEQYIELGEKDHTSILAIVSIKEAFDRYNASVRAIHEGEKNLIAQRNALTKFTQELTWKGVEYKQTQLKFAETNMGLAQAKAAHEAHKKTLLVSLDMKSNPNIGKSIGILEQKVLKRLGGNEAQTKVFMRALNADDTNTLITWFRQTEADVTHLRGMLMSQKKMESSILSIKQSLGQDMSGAQEIRIENMGRLLGEDHAIVSAVREYNVSLSQIGKLENNMKGLSEKLQVKKEITAVDFLMNFMQPRGDLSSRYMQDAFRTELTKNLAKYSSLIHLKINGKEVDIAQEIGKKRSDMLRVNPDDTVELSGPMMIDGVHMATSSDPDKRANMNARTRFFFELVAMGDLLPTEILEPGEKSTFRKDGFERITDALKVKGTYDLRHRRDASGNFLHAKNGKKSSENIEEVLRKQIPIFEKEAFEKLDTTDPRYSEKYESLFAKYYRAQIKALQMMGVLESEDRLNPGGTNINRPIPYFDTENISAVHKSYIASVKTNKLTQNKEVAPYIEFVDIQFYPGDTYGNIFGRIVNNLKNYETHLDQFPNLQYLGSFNDFLKKEFLRQFVELSTKTDSKITWQSMLDGKVKPGTKFILHLSHLNRIIGELRDVSYTADISSKLKSVDSDVIGLMVPVKQNRNLIQSTMYVESYEYGNGKWYVPDGLSRITKSKIEQYPILQKLKNIQSFWDFQIRGIKDLRNDFWEEWITKAQILETISALERPDIKKYISSLPSENQTIISQDLQIIQKLDIVLSRAVTTPEDLSMVTKYLLDLVRFDDGSGSNVVGKIVWASLLNMKMNNHFQKLNGMLQASGEPVSEFSGNQGKMERYENGVYLINNMGEKQAMMGFAENFLYRMFRGITIGEQTGGGLQYATLNRKNGRSLEYKTGDFLRNVEHITAQISSDANRGNRTDGANHIIKKALGFWSSLRAISWDFKNVRVRIVVEMENAQDDTTKLKIKKEIRDSYIQEDTKILREIYALFSDTEFKEVLTSMSIDSSILPTKDEIMAHDSFHSNFFNHVRKGEKIERMVMAEKKDSVG